MQAIKPYKKDFDYTYTSGAYATIELLKARPQLARVVYIHPGCRDTQALTALCRRHAVPTQVDERVFRRINQKENTYVLGVLGKVPSSLGAQAPHVVLVNPADMGNLGTIIRSLVGFGLKDLAVIAPAADIWHPKTIRASMGALFHLRFEYFGSFEDYAARFPGHRLYPFMLDGRTELRPENLAGGGPYSLIFGCEAAGLDARFRNIGTSLRIPQTPLVDSLNLSVAVSIGAYTFSLLG